MNAARKRPWPSSPRPGAPLAADARLPGRDAYVDDPAGHSVPFVSRTRVSDHATNLRLARELRAAREEAWGLALRSRSRAVKAALKEVGVARLSARRTRLADPVFDGWRQIAAASAGDARLRRAVAKVTRIRNEFCAGNFRLVAKIASKIQSTHLSLSDRFTEGCIGMTTAVDRWDPDRGLRFSTYATHWIRHAVFRAIQDTDRTIRLPVHLLDSIRNVHRGKATAGAIDVLAHAPSVNRSLDQRVIAANDDSATLADVIPHNDADQEELAGRESTMALMQMALASLDERSQRIVRARFGLDVDEDTTLDAIGAEFGGICRERVRQLLVKALDRMRRWIARQETASEVKLERRRARASGARAAG